MVCRARSGEVGPPPRRPGLLQGGRNEPPHNPRGHLLGWRQYPPRLGLLGYGRREPDEIRGWLLRGKKVDLERLQATVRWPTGCALKQLLDSSHHRGGTPRFWPSSVPREILISDA